MYKVLYLSNISQPSEMQDVVNTMRTIAEISRVQQIPESRMIVIEGTAEQVALGEKLAAEIDRSTIRFGQLGYRIELKVVEHDKERKERTSTYLLLTRARQTSRASLGRQGPVQDKSESAADLKQSGDFASANIECRIWEENEHTIGMNLEFRLPGVHTESGAASTVLRGKSEIEVELDKPTVISRLDDPDSGGSYTVELTATRVK
ncbi:MAG TPA: hypothetical protein VMT67_09860 [Terriglobales bacterium]|nr:hypothetical protein [Terriglobales bacterium]